jgi:hypothetical protein
MKGTPEMLNIENRENYPTGTAALSRRGDNEKLDDPGFGWSKAVLEAGNHGREDWRQPQTADDEEALFHEPGRVLPSIHEGVGATDCRSHCFKIVKSRHGDYMLIVRHGGGVVRVNLGYSRRIVNAFRQMDSDSRFRLMWTFMDVHHLAITEGADAAAKIYREAFVEGRLKKRHLSARNQTKVWIEPRAGAAAC